MGATAIDSGDTAWVLAATALVLFMTLPGLALFYAGLVRVKNTLSVMMHCVAVACLISVLWLAFGYSLAFDGAGPLIGGYFCDRGIRRGRLDTPLRLMQVGFAATAGAGLIAFNMPTQVMTLTLMGLLTLSFTALLTLSPVALQLLTPGRMRGSMTGIALLIGNITGLGLGPLLPASLARFFYSGSIGPGVTTVVVAAACAGWWLSRSGRPHLIRVLTGVTEHSH